MLKKLISTVVSAALLSSLLVPFGTERVQAAPSSSTYDTEAYSIEQSLPEPSPKIAISLAPLQQLAATSGLSEEDLQAQLESGLTLPQLKQALDLQTQQGLTVDEAAQQVKLAPVNDSANAISTITSETSETFTSQAMAATAATPDYSYVNTKPDEAPYKVNLDQETLSTLTGSLSVHATDLTLPGRNGLGFALSRIYDSSSAQLGKLGFLNGANTATDIPMDEKLYPIGKGWTWNLSYIEKEADKKYMHIADGGTYEITGTTLKGYPWSDLSMAPDTTVTVNGETSSDVLISISGIKQYFTAEGRLIQIADLYGNKLTFTYYQHPTYGKVLASVTDPIGNIMSIAYDSGSVTITAGTKTVTYYKTQQNGKELLTQVIDPLGRATTYDYSISNAQFNLIGTTPNTNNPYALLTGVTHPTGAKTIYTYETTPVTRFIGESSVNQVYRVASRLDRITYSNGSTWDANAKSITYSGDVGSEYAKDLTFSSTVTDGAVSTVFVNEKDYIDKDNPPVHYNNSVTATAGTQQRTTLYTYDRARKWYYPVSTTSTTKNTSTGAVSSNAVSTTNYNDYAQVTTATDPEGGRVEYGYDSTTHWLNSMTKTISPTQKQYTAYTRNTKGTVTKVIVRENNESGTILQQVENPTIDSFGNVLKTVANDGTRNLTTQWEYSAAAGSAYPTKQTATATNIIDSSVATIVQNLAYNTATGKLTSYTDGNTLTTTYQYDNGNRVTQATHPDNSKVKIQYDDFNNTLTSTDETGITTITRYNPLGWKTEVGIVENGLYKAKGKYGYTNQGRLDWSEDAKGNRTTYGYDDWGRQIRVTSPDLAVSTVAYDDIQRTTLATDAENVQVKQTLDRNGRTIQQDEMLTGRTVSTQYTFNQAGQLVTVIDGNTNTTAYTYDALGQLLKVRLPNNEETGYTYNLVGQLKKITYADGTTLSKDYDELGRLTQTMDAAQQVMSQYAYDGNGNVVKQVDKKGQEFIYTYDPKRDWLLSRTVTGKSETVSYAYDLAGRRTTMTDTTGITSYSYSPLNAQLEQVTFPDSRTLTYTYDAVGNRTQMTDPFGLNVYYRYNTNNQLAEVGPSLTDKDASYLYFKNGLLKQVTQGNGVYSAYTYDGTRLKILNQKKADGTILNTYDYTTDNNGNISNRISNGSTVGFSYDKLNRIETSGQLNETYSYDQRGNRKTLTAMNQVDSPAGTYDYDSRDQLTKVTLQDGRQVTYQYNGDGLLWERTENGVTTRYYNDGTQVIAEGTVTSGVATLKARYIRGNGLIAREDATKQKAYYLQNGHGDVTELRDATGATRLNQYDYDIWGNLLTENETIAQPFKYSGELTDPTSKLQYLRARWYDPSMGRFINKDTYEGQLDSPLSQNLYTYVHNNPLIYADPTGNYCVSYDGNWAHGGDCDTKGSVKLGIDDDYKGSPIIQNGKVIGNLNVRGSYRSDPGNYWDIVSEQRFGSSDFAGIIRNASVTGDSIEKLGADYYQSETSGGTEGASLALAGVGGIGKLRLSSPNNLPSAIRNQYEEIKLGRGTPRIDPSTGEQTIFKANELKSRNGGGRNIWEGSLEYDVPGTTHRILKRPDGKLGYVEGHDYSTPKLFPGPWYPEGGK